MSRRPVGRVVAKKKGEKGADLISLGSLWAPPFETDKPMFSLSLGNSNPKYGPELAEVLDILDSGDYFINIYLNDEADEDDDL